MTQNFDPEILSMFQDPDASSAVVMAAQQISAPLIQGSPLTEEEVLMGGGVRVVYLILDASPSMFPVGQALRDGFNNDFVPAIRAAREDDVSALRVGGCAFSSGSPTPIWKGTDADGNVSYFHVFDQLPTLTKAEYDPDKGSGTALHRAITEGTAMAMSHAAAIQRETTLEPDIDIIVLSDGGNNEDMRTIPAEEVKKLVAGRNRSRVRYIGFFFETDWGMPDPDKYFINDLGFDAEQVKAFLAKPGETPEERAHRFRLLMGVMSRVSAARNTSAVVATTTVMADDELV